MINFIYIFTLIILFDQIGIVFDYLIIFLVINFIVIKSISYDKSNLKDLVLIIISSIFLDFITFNYLFYLSFCEENGWACTEIACGELHSTLKRINVIVSIIYIGLGRSSTLGKN